VPRSWLFLLAFVLCPAATDASTLHFSRALGGQPAKPVQVGSYAYLATGAILTTYDYADPTAPLLRHRTDTQPTRGVINALAHSGDYLYASYDGALDKTSGLAVYSLADPARPRLLNQIEDYAGDETRFQNVTNLLLHRGRLYLFDTENGVYVSDLADPLHPQFVRAMEGPITADDVVADGDRIYVTGTNWLGGRMLSVFDASDPEALQELGGGVANGDTKVQWLVAPPLAAAIGFGIDLFDFSDPQAPVTLGRYDDGTAVYFSGVLLSPQAFMLGDRLLHVYDISQPAQLEPPSVFQIDTYFAYEPAKVDGGLLVPTRADRLLRLGLADPGHPTLQSEIPIPGTSVPFDIAFQDGHALLLSNNQGLQIADAATLEVQAAYELPLPARPIQRAYEQVVVADDIAFVASWGSGLMMLDLTAPQAPQPLGLFPYEFAAGLAVDGNVAYVGRVTNGGEVIAVDVSDPSDPHLLGAAPAHKAMRLRATGSHLFVADAESGGATAGLRIFDVGDPSALREVALYDQDCRSVSDLELSADNDTAYLGCENGLHIVDVSSPEEPVRIGWVEVDRPSAPVNMVAVSGDRAWYGTARGVSEIDISDPEHPVVVGELPLPWFARSLRVAPDGRLFAMTGEGGVHVFDVQTAVFRDGFETPAQ
jgi:hypothetical protein